MFNLADWFELTNYKQLLQTSNSEHIGLKLQTSNSGGVEGGFEISKDEIVNGVLVILYHKNLNLVKDKIIETGGEISLDTFSFPGGKRFHFKDPSGNELAIWSEE